MIIHIIVLYHIIVMDEVALLHVAPLLHVSLLHVASLSRSSLVLRRVLWIAVLTPTLLTLLPCALSSSLTLPLPRILKIRILKNLNIRILNIRILPSRRRP